MTSGIFSSSLGFSLGYSGYLDVQGELKFWGAKVDMFLLLILFFLSFFPLFSTNSGSRVNSLEIIDIQKDFHS